MTELTPSDQAKQLLRRAMQQARQALNEADRASLDGRIAGHLLRGLPQHAGQAIAGYHACRGEPDLGSALHTLHHAGCRLHLPVLVDAALQFRRWTPTSRLSANRYGIPEPLDGMPCAAEELDWVLLPLVAFSSVGARLGMGGGYYDRSFGFCLDPAVGPRRPRLIGVAYSLQEVESLPTAPWDVPLDAVVTERGMRRFALEQD